MDIYSKTFIVNYKEFQEALDKEVKDAIKDLWHWQHNNQSYSFTDLLFILFQKADRTNQERLRLGFPAHYIAYNLWYHCLSQDQFFEYYGLKDGK